MYAADCMYTMTQRDAIITKIEHAEERLKGTLYMVEVLERKLKTEQLTTEDREKLETELERVKKALKENKKELQSLRKETSKSSMPTVCLVFVCFLFYDIYLMIFGNVW